jgi:hypothetical protein
MDNQGRLVRPTSALFTVAVPTVVPFFRCINALRWQTIVLDAIDAQRAFGAVSNPGATDAPPITSSARASRVG